MFVTICLGAVAGTCSLATTRVATNSGNFQYRKSQGTLIFFKLRAVFVFYKKFKEVLRIFTKSQGNIFIDLE